jgi:DNA polymerase III delta prime subunit/ribosomal protein L37AE/L43A
MQLRIQDLEGLVANHVRDADVLGQVLDELKLRSTKKAADLQSQVEQLIQELRPNVGSKPKNTGKAGPGESRVPRPATQAAAPAATPKKAASKTPQPRPEAPEPDDTEEKEGPARSEQVSRIRSPESATRTPTKWVPDPTETLQPTWKPSDPAPLRFEKALRLLIQDIKRRGAGAQTIALEDGQRIRLDGAEHAYRFRWQGDEELFEGAAVEIIAGGKVVPGKIVSLGPSELVVDAESDLGPTIRSCVLRIDNTAMLVALADRMASIAVAQGVARSSVGPSAGAGRAAGKVAKSGSARNPDRAPERDIESARTIREAGPFNADLADGVLRNAGPTDAPVVPIQRALVADLNEAQGKAVQAALSSPISYIWGPPGTGKTQTLSAVMRALFAAEKRALVCSNTNQAVDQVLAKLCDVLTDRGRRKPDAVEALRNGWIVRVGAIATDGPLAPWTDWVSLAGVTARKTQDLQTQIAVLEQQAALIERRVLPARQTVQAYQDLDRAIAAEAAAERAAREAAENASARRRALDEAQARLSALQTELKAFDDAGAVRRAFMRGRAKIDADLRAVQSALPAAREASDRAASAAASATTTQRDAWRAREIAAAATAGKDREAARRAVEAAEAELGPIRTSIGDLRRQVEEIAKTVLAQARVVGATATKLFLSPQTFGSFSTVIIDEASMLIPAALYNAAGLATERVIVSGDFRQLSPIVSTNERCLQEELGRDVFSLAGIQRDFDAKRRDLKRTTLLDEQYRMADPICRLLSQPMYRGRLRTSAQRPEPKLLAPAPFAGPLTIVDTSTLGPVAAKDARGSWANLMSALTVRNICRHLSEAGFATDRDGVGAIVPYAGQRKLIQRMLADAKLDTITAGTVHRYQGDEKRLIVLDLVDGIGRLLPGLWHQADQPTDDGAKLFNVALSRARDHLVIVGDLAWLDRKLPAASLLRQWLHQMQDLGSVVDARSILAMWPMAEDLRRYGKTLAVDLEAARTGIFDEKDFLAVVQLDMARAKQGIAIWSAFVTPQGVARIADLLRARVRSGVKVRCIVRPPEQNGTIGEDAWAEGIRALEGVGATIDIRTSMHEKVVLIDDDTAWLGSLNLLSHAGHTREVMLRVDGKQTALGVAAFLAADPKATAERAAGIAYEKENPDCDDCGGRTRFVVAKNGGRFWSCQPCGWTRDARTGKEGRRGGARGGEEAGPACPVCGGPTRKRQGRFGVFWGCSGYPQCNGTVDPDR